MKTPTQHRNLHQWVASVSNNASGEWNVILIQVKSDKWHYVYPNTGEPCLRIREIDKVIITCSLRCRYFVLPLIIEHIVWRSPLKWATLARGLRDFGHLDKIMWFGVINRCDHKIYWMASLQWRHNERDCVSNHQPHDCLLVFIQAQIQENIKAPRHWPLWWEITGNRWIPRTKDQ